MARGRDGWFAFNRQYNAINSREHSLLTHRVTTNLSANYLPVAWFTNRVTLGLDYANDEQTDFSPKNDSTWYGGLTDGGSHQQISRGAERYTVDYLGNVRRTLGAANEWESNLSFGLQVISTRNKFLQATGIGLVTNDNRSINSAATTTGGGAFTEQRSFGYLGQLQMGYPALRVSANLRYRTEQLRPSADTLARLAPLPPNQRRFLERALIKS